MNLTKQIRKDREQFQKLPDRKSRITFIWDYYKIPIIAVLTLFCFLTIIISTNLKRSDVSIYAVLLNSDSLIAECDDTVFDELLKETDVDLKGRHADINDRFFLGMEGNDSEDGETLQVLSAMFSLDEIDVFVADKDHFDLFCKEGAYEDLGTVIPEDRQSKHEDMLYRYEEDNGKIIIAGLILKENSPLHKAGYYHNEVILGMAANCGHKTEASALIDLLIK